MQGAVFRCEGLHPLTRSGAGIEARNFLTPHAGETLSLMEKEAFERSVMGITFYRSTPAVLTLHGIGGILLAPGEGERVKAEAEAVGVMFTLTRQTEFQQQFIVSKPL